jgi:formiminoglutamase
MITVPKALMISFLKLVKQKYVLLGIPEDIGIRANYGRPEQPPLGIAP